MKRPSLKELQAQCADSAAAVSPRLLRTLQRDPRAGAQKLYKSVARRAAEQKKEKNRREAMLHFERVLWKAGVVHVAGVDEVGMGPLAGPVVAAAVIFPPGTVIDEVDDSKALSPETRTRLDTEIRARAAAVGIGIVDVAEIDRINIYHAGLRAMRVALDRLPLAPQHVLVDGRTIPDITQPQNSFDKGDGISFSIACASIVAKVFRDRLMTDLDSRYPGYGFAGHKGYATPEHQNAIRELGPCPIHRRSFDYIRELCGQYSALYYDMKERGSGIASRADLSLWEQDLKAIGEKLSDMESKKLCLMKNRLWKRIAAAT